jgi:hypothetical protein
MPALMISAFALVFTIGAFWWIQVRRGHLVSYPPDVYSGYLGQQGFRLRLPLTIYNTGAKTLVVVDLRATFVAESTAAPAITFRSSLKPVKDDVLDFAHPFPVDGRRAVMWFVEFGRSDWSPQPKTRYEVRVDARAGDRRMWSELVRVTLTTPNAETASHYITHRCDPTDSAPEPTQW